MIHHGDCIEVMAGMPAESVDAVVCDPPYGLGFMGKEWDRIRAEVRHTNSLLRAGGQANVEWHPNAFQEWCHRWATEAFRVAKPSAYLLAFGGTRTVHRLASAIEDAGWIIRDMLVWGYASGFPKSKASLKPAWEPIVMARKPGPLRDLAIDACRIGTDGGTTAGERARKPDGRVKRWEPGNEGARNTIETLTAGRWPANIILTDPIFDGGWDGVVGGGWQDSGPAHTLHDTASRALEFRHGESERLVAGGSGTYSRFFLIPRRYNKTCVRCGLASDAEPSSSLRSPSAGTAPSGAPTSPDGPPASTSRPTDSRSTSGTETQSWLVDDASTPSTPRSKRRVTSPASGPGSSPAKSPDAGSPAIDTTTTTADRWMCATCAEAITSATTSPSPESRNYPFAFLIPKADRADREPVLGGLPERTAHHTMTGQPIPERRPVARQNVHPTVKPTELMRHLVRLVTPAGGTVLDPFLGSGTTAIAAELEGFPWIGIEREAEYVAIAEARLNGTQRGLGLTA